MLQQNHSTNHLKFGKNTQKVLKNYEISSIAAILFYLQHFIQRSILLSFCVFQIIKIPKVLNFYMRSIQLFFRMLQLSSYCCRDFSVQLSADALGPKQTDLLQRIHCQLVILKRTKGGWVLLNIWCNQFFGLPEGCFKTAGFKVFRKKFFLLFMITAEVFLLLHQIMV